MIETKDDKAWVQIERSYSVKPYETVKVSYGCSKTLDGGDPAETALKLHEGMLAVLKRMIRKTLKEVGE